MNHHQAAAAKLATAGNHWDSLLVAMCAVWAIVFGSSALATTLAGMDIDVVANDAELIFEGEVLLQEARRDSISGRINTYVTFSVRDVIKGDYDADTLELRFTGGTLGDEITEVSGLVIPALGEQGIYFVESVSRNLLNPLLGWSQGHFIIVEEEGERRIATLERQPIVEIQAVASIPSVIKKPQVFIEGKGEVAAGVITDTSELTLERALTVEQFKSSIRNLLEN